MQRALITLCRGLPLLIDRSIKMYRQRIKDWGLDKNHKDNEMKAIVRKYEGRVAEGKASTIRIRGRSIDYQDVVRYWKRKHLTIDAVLALRSMSKTPEAVECLTPMPSPITTPEVLAVPERILRMLRDYHQGSFEAGTWRSDGSAQYCRSTKVSNDGIHWAARLFDQCTLSFRLIEYNAFEEASRELGRACASIEQIVLAEFPDTFILLLVILQDAFRCPRPEIGLDILGHISAMGGILLGDQHPFKLVCGWLASLDLVAQGDNKDILPRSSKVVYECFKKILGPLHRVTITSLLYHFALVRNSGQNTKYQELAMYNLLHECETALGQDDVRTLDARFNLACYYQIRGGEYTAAREQAEALVQSNSKYDQIQGLKVLADSLVGLGEIHKAINTQRQAVDLAIEEWGGGDAQTQLVMLEAGMLESAARVREERLGLRDEEVEEVHGGEEFNWDADDIDLSSFFNPV